MKTGCDFFFPFQMMFGADGYLYIFFGDGGGAGDPMASAQNKYVSAPNKYVSKTA